MEDTRLWKIIVCAGLLVCISEWSNCLPAKAANGEQALGEDIRKIPENKGSNVEPREGVISNWIQNIKFNPLGINVPGIISNTTSEVQHVVGEGFQNASTTVGQGFQNFGLGVQAVGQTVGNGIKNFGEALGEGYQAVVTNIGQRFPLINRLPMPGMNKIEDIPELPITPQNQTNSLNSLDPEVPSNSNGIKMK